MRGVGESGRRERKGQVGVGEIPSVAGEFFVHSIGCADRVHAIKGSLQVLNFASVGDVVKMFPEMRAADPECFGSLHVQIGSHQISGDLG